VRKILLVVEPGLKAELGLTFDSAQDGKAAFVKED